MTENSKEVIVGVSECENEIKKLFKTMLTDGTPKEQVKKQGMRIITTFTDELEKVDLNLANRMKRMLVDFLVRNHKSLLEQVKLMSKKSLKMNDLAVSIGAIDNIQLSNEKLGGTYKNGVLLGGTEEQRRKVAFNIREFYTTGETGSSQMLIDDYRSKVNGLIETLPNRKAYEQEQQKQNKKFRKRSARSICENSVRYNERVKDMNKLQENGVKYVIASSHRNASERCSFWQGKIFILDTTETFQTADYSAKNKPNPKIIGHVDGKPYYSLKEALSYGFLGYNCRHRLIKYTSGMPMPKEFKYKDISKWRAINDRQRQIERTIVKYKNEALFATSPEKSKKLREMARLWKGEYEAFCKEHDLVIERWRTCISKNERDFFVDDRS